LRVAAELGLSSAQSDLGVQYARGRGVERNDVEAYKSFTIAIKNGRQEAATNRKLLEKRMSDQNIAEGERQAAEFVPKKVSTQR
jgi:TPR repeat protein